MVEAQSSSTYLLTEDEGALVQEKSLCSSQGALATANDPLWFVDDQYSRPPAEICHQDILSPSERLNDNFHHCSDQSDDLYYGISFDMPPAYAGDPEPVLLSFFNTVRDDCSSLNDQAKGPDDVTTWRSAIQNPLSSHAGDTSASPNPLSIPPCYLTATARISEGTAHLVSSNNKCGFASVRSRSRSPVTQVLPPASMASSLASATAAVPPKSALYNSKPARRQWQPIKPKPGSGAEVAQETSLPTYNCKRPASPREEWRQVDDCLIGVFNGVPGGPNQNNPKKRRKTPNACVRCQLDRKACSGGHPCQRCFQFLESGQNNKIVYWKHCVDSDILDVNPILNILQSIMKFWRRTVYRSNRYRLTYLRAAYGSLWGRARMAETRKFQSKLLARIMSTPENLEMPTVSTYLDCLPKTPLVLPILGLHQESFWIPYLRRRRSLDSLAWEVVSLLAHGHSLLFNDRSISSTGFAATQFLFQRTKKLLRKAKTISADRDIESLIESLAAIFFFAKVANVRTWLGLKLDRMFDKVCQSELPSLSWKSKILRHCINEVKDSEVSFDNGLEHLASYAGQWLGHLSHFPTFHFQVIFTLFQLNALFKLVGDQPTSKNTTSNGHSGCRTETSLILTDYDPSLDFSTGLAPQGQDQAMLATSERNIKILATFETEWENSMENVSIHPQSPDFPLFRVSCFMSWVSSQSKRKGKGLKKSKPSDAPERILGQLLKRKT
ncbi:hypothetical protein F5Y19DRAFT_189367 [Xylariaceae sp. FL1651]|nr:hypothetical protein F5Y19DRAFT_189367 [Xylariaceae sp. FL1651]